MLIFSDFHPTMMVSAPFVTPHSVASLFLIITGIPRQSLSLPTLCCVLLGGNAHRQYICIMKRVISFHFSSFGIARESISINRVEGCQWLPSFFSKLFTTYLINLVSKRVQGSGGWHVSKVEVRHAFVSVWLCI